MRASSRLLQFLAVASLFMIAISASAGSVSGPVVVLPNSYYLQPDQGGQTKLVKRDGKRLLPGTIAAYVVSGQLVVGAIGATPPPVINSPMTSPSRERPTHGISSSTRPPASLNPTSTKRHGTSGCRTWGSVPICISIRHCPGRTELDLYTLAGRGYLPVPYWLHKAFPWAVV